MAGPDKIDGLPKQPLNISSPKAAALEPPIAKNTSASPHPQDSVALSPENTEYAQLLKRIDEVPDIRQDRVAHIRKALEEGTYDIDSHLVAERIIREIVSENVPEKNQPDVPDTSKSS